MRSPNELWVDLYENGECTLLQVIKTAQIEAYNQAIEDAAKSAYCDIVHPPDEDYPELEESEYVVIKRSILKLKI